MLAFCWSLDLAGPTSCLLLKSHLNSGDGGHDWHTEVLASVREHHIIFVQLNARDRKFCLVYRWDGRPALLSRLTGSWDWESDMSCVTATHRARSTGSSNGVLCFRFKT
jgi:hypothetical protein